MTEIALYFIVFSVFIALFAILLFFAAKKSTEKHEAESLAINAATVLEKYGDSMLDRDFMWVVWQGQAEVKEMKMFVRNEQNMEVTTIHCPTLINGTERRWFNWDGKHYSQNKTSNFSVLMEYRQKDNPEVLFSSKNTLNKIIFYQGNTRKILFTVVLGTVFSKYSRIMQENKEIGRIISTDKISGYSRALSCLPGHLSTLEKLILLMAL